MKSLNRWVRLVASALKKRNRLGKVGEVSTVRRWKLSKYLRVKNRCVDSRERVPVESTARGGVNLAQLRSRWPLWLERSQLEVCGKGSWEVAISQTLWGLVDHGQDCRSYSKYVKGTFGEFWIQKGYFQRSHQQQPWGRDTSNIWSQIQVDRQGNKKQLNLLSVCPWIWMELFLILNRVSLPCLKP